MMQSAKLLWAIQRLSLIWLSLWLAAPFAGTASAWQHLDGTFCPTCNFAAPIVGDDWEQESPAEIGIRAPDDCQKCCAQTSPRAPEKLLSHFSQTAILPARMVFNGPARRETRLKFAFPAQHLDVLPRPPPCGRAPPILF
jgi:hypothetical protein